MRRIRDQIAEAMNRNREGWRNVVLCTLSDHALDQPQAPGAVLRFTLWTDSRVYIGTGLQVLSVLRDPPSSP